jgi:hypothetical protein
MMQVSRFGFHVLSGRAEESSHWVVFSSRAEQVQTPLTVGRAVELATVSRGRMASRGGEAVCDTQSVIRDRESSEALDHVDRQMLVSLSISAPMTWSQWR